MPFRTLFYALLALTPVMSWASALADESKPSPEQAAERIAFFEREVRPLLVKHCGECHSTEKGPDHGALILDDPAAIAAGGARGGLFDAAAPEKGLFLTAIRYTDAELQMPPAGKLSAAEIALFEQWVLNGATLPEYKEAPRAKTHAIDYEAGRKFWSFQPLAAVELPAVPPEDAAWIRRPLDAFVLAKLRESGRKPSPEASRAVWLRRATFDAIGLPPTLEELDTFLADTSPDAYEKVVDRLLDSPRYGERWARMWLDLARYTDETPDWQSPTDRGWLYRDWVIKSLNDDMPYDRFLRLQLGADQMPDVQPSDYAALGFLGLSPVYWKELMLAPGVIEQIVADEWDERLDTVMRTSLGLTVACARCHDHKFDPISTQDYYGLAGVFASSQIDERPLLPQEEAEVVRAARKQVKELEAKLKPLKEAKEPDIKKDEIATIEAQITELKKTPKYEEPWAHVVREAAIFVLPNGPDATKLEYKENEARDVAVFRRGNPTNQGEIVPRRFPTLFRPEGTEGFRRGSGRLDLAEAMIERSGGLLARVMVNRIWDQHFGAGLVRTPSDFGIQGERPTHPELLEYLSQQFVASGWRLKPLHREIMLSALYRQASDARADNDATDPDNRYLWRMNRRRLPIEMWRDATLAATGQLDITPGGPSRPVEEDGNSRRTIYARVAREELSVMLRMHDFPEASAHSPRREPTTTPLQQLFALNSPWIERQSDAMWKRLEPLADDDARIDQAYRLLFARMPVDTERSLAHRYLASAGDKPEDRAARWQDYLQALFGLNEFHFVD
jgi:mono/diheme cytochrome c family protein